MTDNIASAGPEPASSPMPLSLAVFGRDEGGKAHASRFDPADAALAEKAAGLMGMRVLRLETAEHHALAAQLPAGRVFESGRAFVPFVKGALFDQLDKAPEAFSPARPPRRRDTRSGPAQGQGRPSGAGRRCRCRAGRRRPRRPRRAAG